MNVERELIPENNEVRRSIVKCKMCEACESLQD